MPVTRRGVYHNLKESKYVVSNEDITFFFSSEYTLNKFLDGYEKNREIMRPKLFKNIDTVFNYDFLIDFEYYKRVEKRGCHVWLKGVTISSDETLPYALRMMLEKKSPEWVRTERKSPAERFK